MNYNTIEIRNLWKKWWKMVEKQKNKTKQKTQSLQNEHLRLIQQTKNGKYGANQKANQKPRT